MKRDCEGKTKVADEKVADLFNKKAKSCGTWSEADNGNVLIFTHERFRAQEKVAGFDMDGTLITTKSGKVFPLNEEDWKLISATVPKKLKTLQETGFSVVIFTNQKGIQVGKVDKNKFKKKIENIINSIGCPIKAFISVGGGMYRKPCTGMWDLLKSLHDGVAVNVEKSLYVGDAAGRHKTKIHLRKDHSCADRYFAMNVGLPFETAESYFMDRKTEDPWGPPAFEPSKFLNTTVSELEPSDTVLPTNEPEIIVMVGFPGSGKSTFSRKVAEKHGYIVVNRDTLGTWQKCVGKARSALKEGKSVIVDNTNPDLESRKRYIELANEMSVACRCFEMNCTLAQAQHNVKFRLLTQKNATEVGTMVLRMFNSKYKRAEKAEGFSEVVLVNIIPDFNSEEDRQLYGQYLTDA